MTLHNLPNLALTLADSVPDISNVPAEFVRSFFIMLAFVAAIGGGGWFFFGRPKKATGQQNDPMHVAQPVEIKKHTEYAPKEETRRAIRELDEKIEKLREEWLGQVTDLKSAVGEDLAALREAGSSRGETILRSLHDMEVRMTQSSLKEFKALHERVNPIAENVAAHEALLNRRTKG